MHHLRGRFTQSSEAYRHLFRPWTVEVVIRPVVMTPHRIARLREAHAASTPWKKWGPYLSERQWGTVREDYSQDGKAWDYFSHDQARSRAYHWGRMGSPASVTTGSISALRWHSGRRIPY